MGEEDYYLEKAAAQCAPDNYKEHMKVKQFQEEYQRMVEERMYQETAKIKAPPMTSVLKIQDRIKDGEFFIHDTKSIINDELILVIPNEPYVNIREFEKNQSLEGIDSIHYPTRIQYSPEGEGKIEVVVSIEKHKNIPFEYDRFRQAIYQRKYEEYINERTKNC